MTSCSSIDYQGILEVSLLDAENMSWASLASAGFFVFFINNESKFMNHVSMINKQHRFSQKYYYDMSKVPAGNRVLRVQLWNVVLGDNIRVAESLYELDPLDLKINEPQCQEYQLRGDKKTCRFKLQLCFLHNLYIQQEQGTIECLVQNLDSKNKATIYSLNFNGQTRLTSNPGTILETYCDQRDPFLNLDINVYPGKKITDYSNEKAQLLKQLKPEFQSKIYLCALSWKLASNQLDLVATHNQDFKGEKNSCSIRLKFTMSSKKIELKKQVSVMEQIEEKIQNSVVERFQWLCLRIRRMDVSQISFKEIKTPSLYVTMQVKASMQTSLFTNTYTISHICSDSTIYKWCTDILLYFKFDDLETAKVVFKVYDLNVSTIFKSDGDKELQKLPKLPLYQKELLVFEMSLKQFIKDMRSQIQKKKIGSGALQYRITQGKVTSTYATFLRQSYAENKPKYDQILKILENNPPILNIEFTSRSGDLIEWPFGILGLTNLSGQFSLQQDNAESTITKSVYQVQLGQLIQKFEPQDGYQTAPSINVDIQGICFSPRDILKFSVFNHKDEYPTLMAQVDLPVTEINFHDEATILTLGDYSEKVSGQINLKLQYTPLKDEDQYGLMLQNVEQAEQPQGWGGVIVDAFRVNVIKPTLKQTFYNGCYLFLRIGLERVFLKQTTGKEKVQVVVEVDDQRLQSSHFGTNLQGFTGLDQQNALFILNPLNENHQNLTFSVILYQSSMQQDEIVASYIGVLQWHKLNLIMTQVALVDVMLNNPPGASKQFIDVNYLQVSIQTLPFIMPKLYIQDKVPQPVRLKFNLHSLKSLNREAHPKLEGGKLYLMRISTRAEFKKYTITFARLASKPPMKNIILLPSKMRRNYLRVNKLENITRYKNPTDKIEEKILIFQKPLSIIVESMESEITFEICQITSFVNNPDDWSLDEMRRKSVVVYRAIRRAADLIYDIKDDKFELPYIAMEMQYLANNEINVDKKMKSDDIQLGFDPASDAIADDLLVMKVEYDYMIPTMEAINDTFSKELKMQEHLDLRECIDKEKDSTQQLYSQIQIESYTQMTDTADHEEYSCGHIIELGGQDIVSDQTEINRAQDIYDYPLMKRGTYSSWELNRVRISLQAHHQLYDDELNVNIRTDIPKLKIRVLNLRVRAKMTDDQNKQLIPQYSLPARQELIDFLRVNPRTNQRMTYYHILKEHKFMSSVVKMNMKLQNFSRKYLSKSMDLFLHNLEIFPLDEPNINDFQFQDLSVKISILSQDPWTPYDAEYILHCEGEYSNTILLADQDTAKKQEVLRKYRTKPKIDEDDEQFKRNIQFRLKDVLLDRGVMSKELNLSLILNDLQAMILIEVYDTSNINHDIMISRRLFPITGIQFTVATDDKGNTDCFGQMYHVLMLDKQPQNPTQLRNPENGAYMIRLNLKLKESDSMLDQQVQIQKERRVSLGSLVKVRKIGERASKLVFVEMLRFGSTGYAESENKDYLHIGDLYSFSNSLKRGFRGMDQKIIQAEFDQMTKVFTLEKGLKKFYPTEFTNKFIHFKLQQESMFMLQSSLDTQFRVEIAISVLLGEGEEMRFPVHLRNTQYTFEESRGISDEIESVKIIIERDVDIFIHQQIIQRAQFIKLEFLHYNKSGDLLKLVGAIEEASIEAFKNQEVLSIKDCLSPTIVLLLMKPTNQRLFLNIRLTGSHFLNQPVGELQLHLIRLIRIDKTMINTSMRTYENIEYKNVNLLQVVSQYKDLFKQRETIVDGKFQFDEKNIFKDNRLSMVITCNNQKDMTSQISTEGLLASGYFDYFNFMTSHTSDELKLQLILSVNTEKEEGKIAQNKEKKQYQEYRLKPDDPTRVLKPLEGMIIAESFLPLGCLLANSDAKGFFIQKLNPICYPPTSDALRHFYTLVNNKDLYALGSVRYVQRPWISILVKLVELKNIKFNLDWQGLYTIENEERIPFTQDLIHFYFKATINFVLEDSTLREISQWSSKVYLRSFEDLKKNQVQTFPLDDCGPVSCLYHFDDDVFSVYCLIEFFIDFHQTKIKLGERFIPLTQYTEKKQGGTLTFPLIIQANSDEYKVIDESQENTFKVEVFVSEEMPYVAENMHSFIKEQVKPTEDQEVQAPHDKYLSLMVQALNTNNMEDLQTKIDELDQLLLYSRPQEYEQQIDQLIIGLVSIARVYNDHHVILMLTIKAIYLVLIGQNSLFLQFERHSLTQMFIEILYFYCKQYSPQVPEKFNDFGVLFLYSEFHLKSIEQQPTKPIEYSQIEKKQLTLQDTTNYVIQLRIKSDDYGRQIDQDDRNFALFGKTILYSLDILDFYMNGNIERTLQMVPYFPMITEVYLRYDQFVDNMANHFCYMVNNLVRLYGEIEMANYIEGEEEKNTKQQKNLDIKEFPRMLNVLLQNANIATASEFNSIIKTIHNLMGFFRGKDKIDLITDQLQLYYDTLLSRLVTNMENLNDLDQQLTIILDNILTSQSIDIPYTYLSNAFKREPLEPQFIPILKTQLNNKYSNENEESEHKYMLKNALEILTLAIKEYGCEEPFNDLRVLLKDRAKAIKNSRKKFYVDQFLTFLAQRETLVNRMEQARRGKKGQIDKQQKAKIDIKSKQQQIATKYMISKLDW